MPVTSMKRGSLAATCPHVGQRLVFKSTREFPVEVKPLGERKQGKGFSSSFVFFVSYSIYVSVLCCFPVPGFAFIFVCASKGGDVRAIAGAVLQLGEHHSLGKQWRNLFMSIKNKNTIGNNEVHLL